MSTDFRKDTDEPRHSLGGLIFLMNSKGNCMMESKLIALSDWMRTSCRYKYEQDQKCYLDEIWNLARTARGCLICIGSLLPPQSNGIMYVFFPWRLVGGDWRFLMCPSCGVVTRHLFLFSEIHLVEINWDWTFLNKPETDDIGEMTVFRNWTAGRAGPWSLRGK